MGYISTHEVMFEQSTPSTVWDITHPCKYPIVDVFINGESAMQKMIPFNVNYISDTNCRITFSNPYAGFAVLTG